MPFGDVQRLGKVALLRSNAIRQIRKRGSVSAETILPIMIARGVSEEDLISIKASNDAKFSKSLAEWTRLGNSLSERQGEQLVKLVNFLLSGWSLK